MSIKRTIAMYATAVVAGGLLSLIVVHNAVPLRIAMPGYFIMGVVVFIAYLRP